MQVILLEKVANLGNLGDIVKVKDGFGRNFLIPQGKAKRATDSNKAEFEAKRAELEKQQVVLLDEEALGGKERRDCVELFVTEDEVAPAPVRKASLNFTVCLEGRNFQIVSPRK